MADGNKKVDERGTTKDVTAPETQEGGLMGAFKNNQGLFLGIGGAIIGLLLGGGGVAGLVVAAIVGLLAAFAGPMLLDKIPGYNSDDKNKPLPALAEQNGASPSQSVAVAKERDIVVTSAPSNASPNKMVIDVDGQQYDVAYTLQNGEKGKLIATNIKLKPHGTDESVPYFGYEGTMELAKLNGRDFAFDDNKVNKLASELGKSVRGFSAGIGQGITASLTQRDQDTVELITKDGVIFKVDTNGNQLEIKNLVGETLRTAPLTEAAQTNKNAFARSVADNIAAIAVGDKDVLEKISRLGTEVKYTLPTSQVSAIADEREADQKKTGPLLEHAVTIDGVEHTYKIQSAIKDNNKLIATSVQLDDLPPVTLKQPVELGSYSVKSTKDESGNITSTPEFMGGNAGVEASIKTALALQDEKLKKLKYTLTKVGTEESKDVRIETGSGRTYLLQFKDKQATLIDTRDNQPQPIAVAGSREFSDWKIAVKEALHIVTAKEAAGDDFKDKNLLSNLTPPSGFANLTPLPVEEVVTPSAPVSTPKTDTTLNDMVNGASFKLGSLLGGMSGGR